MEISWDEYDELTENLGYGDYLEQWWNLWEKKRKVHYIQTIEKISIANLKIFY